MAAQAGKRRADRCPDGRIRPGGRGALPPRRGLHESEFALERPSPDPDTRSLRAICEHVVFAALGYSNYLLRMQSKPAPLPDSKERIAQRREVAAARALRAPLVAAVRATEDAVESLRGLSDEDLGRLTLEVGWGAVYQPESLLEHAIVHLLRHRQQLERWSLPMKGRSGHPASDP